MQATQVFGAYGSGWGIKDCKFTILELGFSADVYMGLYDDVQYVKDAGIKHSSKSRQAEWVAEVIKSIESTKSPEDLVKCKRRIENMSSASTVPEDYIDAINQALYDKEQELK
jgi:hypothetical protein